MMRFDTDERFFFSALQSDTASKHLSPEQTRALESLVLLENGKALEKSTAVIRVLRHLGGPWAVIAGAIQIAPTRLSDGVYDWVARHRYGWFGTKESCRIPSASERKRFLL